MNDVHAIAESLSNTFSEIYHYCHPQFQMELSHQAVRALQYVKINPETTIQHVANHLGIAPNTASEIIRRLSQKGLVERNRDGDDERVVRVVVTEVGTRVLKEHTGLNLNRLQDRLEALTEQEQRVILENFVRLRDLVREDKRCG